MTSPSAETEVAIRSQRFPGRLDITFLANIRALIPDVEDLEHLPILHFASRQELLDTEVDATKREIQEYILRSFNIRQKKRRFFINIGVPRAHLSNLYGGCTPGCFWQPHMEVLNAHQDPVKHYYTPRRGPTFWYIRLVPDFSPLTALPIWKTARRKEPRSVLRNKQFTCPISFSLRTFFVTFWFLMRYIDLSFHRRVSTCCLSDVLTPTLLFSWHILTLIGMPQPLSISSRPFGLCHAGN